ncbi:MAG: dTMP kinase [Candidatus Staskawiczbacteria bacterium RIFCSPHIGHO2_02_FULL_42_22]|uniref:Thymidylate kinase n=1 Tax=Candidatus Staskawiczbacteria bacterium RIFCSPHIGHO2_02_FULL_42_22 TaxID=1802207 RepID=A0A1G2I2Y1_9BACT|nr:MAG: dTMP kinase [Candidatus Staskawiczbacteria bacterium RIFCSPHIGHO2_02_FULL_42_22]
MPKGNFFVFEGIDGSGKSTQSNLLSDFLKNQGRKVEKIDFPQYGKKSAALLENYLTGLYGTAEEVGAYRSSIFFASDRYDAGFQIKKWLNEGKIVVSDRYVVSNVGHQGGKLIHNKQEWEKYVDWLYDLEYNIFKIPRPDYTFILKISPELSMKMSNKITDPEKIKKRIAYLGDDKKQDIHESDKQHLADTLESYIEIAKKFPEEFKVIDCQQDEEFLPINVIQEKIKKLVQEKIN